MQAKLLDNLDVEYAHLDHKIGSSGTLQIDQLLATARARNIPALYVFYNHVTDTSRIRFRPAIAMDAKNAGDVRSRWHRRCRRGCPTKALIL